jgi:phage/plasmid-associated DNA primase
MDYMMPMSTVKAVLGGDALTAQRKREPWNFLDFMFSALLIA